MKKAVEAEKRQARAILFELENLAVGGRQILFNVLKNAMSEKDVELTPVLFARHCLDATLKGAVLGLAKEQSKKRFSEEKLVEGVVQGLETAFSRGNLKPDSAMNLLIKKAAEAGVPVGALSSLSRETTDKLLKTLGWEDKKLHLLCCPSSEKVFPTADAWLKLAKAMLVRPCYCVVLTASMKSCKSALSAGMRSVAVVDDYTAFQDFGGADHVAEGMGKDVVEKVFDLLDIK